MDALAGAHSIIRPLIFAKCSEQILIKFNERLQSSVN